MNTSPRFGIYDVFADRPYSGNQAAVIREVVLSDRQLLTLAAEFLLPETTVCSGESNTLQLRFATADRIVARCGHATLAAVADYSLSTASPGAKLNGMYIVSHVTAPWRSEILEIGRVKVEVAWPELPVFKRNLRAAQVAGAISLKANDLHASLPLCVYDSGNKHALLPVASIGVLRKAKPLLSKLRRLFDRERLTDLHLYHLERKERDAIHIKAHCRNIFPYGVQEEAATGSASIALAQALIKHFAIGGKPTSFHFLQSVGQRRGNIRVEQRAGAKGKGELWLIGQVFCTATGRLIRVPQKGIPKNDN